MRYKEEVVLSVTTPEEPSNNPSMEIVPGLEEPVPLENIAPGKPGNEIDVENLADFSSVLNQVFPPMPPSRRSKRQSGYKPDLTQSKRFRGTGESSTQIPSLADPEYTSGDASNDEDYEFVACKKYAHVSASRSFDESKAPISAEEEKVEEEQNPSDDEDVSLANFFEKLKKDKIPESIPTPEQPDDTPDAEMQQEFEDNIIVSYDSSSSISNNVDATINEEELATKYDTTIEDQVVEEDVATIEGNIVEADFDLSLCFFFLNVILREFYYPMGSLCQQRTYCEEKCGR